MPKVKDFYQRIEIIDECFRQKSCISSTESGLVERESFGRLR